MVHLISDAWKWLGFKRRQDPITGPVGEDAPSVVPVGPGWPGLMPQANASAAMRSAAVWACCNIISKAVASLPACVLEETDVGYVEAKSHPLYRILSRSPNPMMTLQQWIQPTMLHLLLWGNAFTYIDRFGEDIIGLWPLLPDRMRILNKGDVVEYTYVDTHGAGHVYTPGEDIIPFRLFSADGFVGLSVLQFHALTLDFQDASATYTLNLYKNGGRPTGVLEYPGNLQKPQIDKIRESWQTIHGGPMGAGKVAILDGGVKYSPIAIPPETMQFIETQKFSVEQIARLFGVAPHLIGSLDKPTYASVEQQSIEFLRYTVTPYVKALETSIDAALLEDPYGYRFNLNSFERSDIRSRYAAYATGRQWGWLSANDVRRLEDQNSIGPEGDTYLTPLNMAPAGTEPGGPAVSPPPVPAGQEQ